MTDSATDWQLDEFDVALDRWIEVERPTSDLVIIVADWLLNRATTPYASVERDPGFVNRWWGQVPGSAVDGRVVVCVYLGVRG